jgi:hypothetical protein
VPLPASTPVMCEMPLLSAPLDIGRQTGSVPPIKIDLSVRD